MIGIYKYTNKINNKVYIGQSVDLKRRWYNHKSAAYNPAVGDYNSQFHQAIRKYGLENFNYKILVEIPEDEYTQEKLDELERYYIKYYDSYANGYNATDGGVNTCSKEGKKGEKNGRALLTEKDVEYIRECYNAHIPFRQVYEEFEDKISKRGLRKIWEFDNWQYIHPEYHTEENKYWHAHQAKANPTYIAVNNKRRFGPNEVREMRQEYNNGLSVREILEKHGPDMAYGTIYNILIKKTYKDIE